MSRVRLGELVIQAGLVTPTQLAEVLAVQQVEGRRLGALLVQRGLMTDTQVTQILSQQLSIPWVSLHHIGFSRRLLDLVPSELAERWLLLPIYMRRVPRIGEILYLVMEDPANEQALDEVGRVTGLKVRPMIASPSEIRAALRAYYGCVIGSLPPVAQGSSNAGARAGERVAARSDGSESEEEYSPLSDELEEIDEGALPESERPTDADLVVLPRVALRLADGSELEVGAWNGEGTGAPGASLGEADQRASVSEAPDVRHWRGLCAALLSQLQERQLIRDWEFVPESTA